MKTIITITLVTLLTGCVAISGESARLPIQYGTLKVVSEGIATPQEITDHVTRLREVVDTDESITIAALERQLLMRIKWERMAPEDEFLVRELVRQVSRTLDNSLPDSYVSDQRRVQINTVLDWITDATRYSR